MPPEFDNAILTVLQYLFYFFIYLFIFICACCFVYLFYHKPTCENLSFASITIQDLSVYHYIFNTEIMLKTKKGLPQTPPPPPSSLHS